MKTDPRTRYTKSLIQSTFLALLHDKPVSRITVSEICAKAEINRGTFYRYYLDVYDLSDQVMAESLDQVDAMIHRSSGESFSQTFAEGLRILRDDPKLFFMAVSGSILPEGENTFLEKMFRRFADVFAENLADSDAEKNARTLSYVSGGSGALIAYWLRSGAKESPEEIAGLIEAYAGLIIREENRKALDR